MARKTISEILHGETKFGRLTVLIEVANKGRYRRVLCRCDCGNEVVTHTFSLTGGRTKSCGCYRSEIQSETARKVGLLNKRHGQTGTPEYRAWMAAISRCESRGHKAYSRYGGRGIVMCPEWRESFEAFYSDMGARPSPRHTLERVDNSSGYNPQNCEWRQWESQNRNRRNTVMVEWRGRIVSLAKLAARAKVDYGNLHRRARQLGWDAEEALRCPLRQMPK